MQNFRAVIPAADRQRDPRYPGRIVRTQVESSRRYVRWLPYPPERIERLTIRPVIGFRKPRPSHFSFNDSGRYRIYPDAVNAELVREGLG